VTATRLLIHARPRRVDSWLVPRGRRGCVAAAPLRVRGLSVGPPLLLPGGNAVAAAAYDEGEAGVDYHTGLALIKIRR
jgi:hypothetical protein